MARKEIKTWLNSKADCDKFASELPNLKMSREVEFATSIIRQDKDLQKCSFESVKSAIENAISIGITLNPSLNLSYLKADGENCTLDFTYLGLTAILKKYNLVQFMDAVIVYEDDFFEEDMMSFSIKHIPSHSDKEDKKIKGVYSRAIDMNGRTIVSPLYLPSEADKAGEMSNNKLFWRNWKTEAYKKFAIRRFFKYFISTEMPTQIINAIEIEDKNNGLRNEFLSSSPKTLDGF